LEDAQKMLGALSNLAGSMAVLKQSNMDQINAEADLERSKVEDTMANGQAKDDLLHKLDIKRWERLKKEFEAQKKWKEAQAWIDFASGSIGIWTSPTATSSPIGAILAGIQQAALLATTIASVKSIRSQQMLKPQSSSGGGSTGGSAPNVSMSPSREALTTRDENLNAQARANIDKMPTPIVKVSDINDVQKTVNVRESNSQI
jgi:hypothetical protein